MSTKSPVWNSLKFASIGLALLSQTTCSTLPNPIKNEQRATRIQQDWQRMFQQQEPVGRKLDIYQAMARAVKYNMDLRLKAVESLVGRADWHLSRYDMLPQILGSAGLLSRSNILGSSSRALTAASPAPTTTSQENTVRIADLRGIWNILDFGVTYLTSQQKSDEYLVTLERRRKMMQNIIRDVRYAYWRALVADRLQHRLTPFIREIRVALAQSQTIEKEKLKSPIKSLLYRKNLLETLRDMVALNRDLGKARSELASLINVSPRANFVLQHPRGGYAPIPQHFPKNIRVLESIALQHRPEMREEDYRKRISLLDVRKARLRMLPGLEIDGGVNYDSNKFLLNNTWADVSLQLTWNLIRIFSGPAAIRHAKFGAEVADFRRMALAMAVITQVDVAKFNYLQAQRELRVAKQLLNVNRRLYSTTQSEYRAEKIDRLAVINAKAEMLLADLRAELAYAEWQNSGGQVIASIGYDPVARVIPSQMTVAQLAKEIKLALDSTPMVLRSYPHQQAYHEDFTDPQMRRTFVRNHVLHHTPHDVTREVATYQNYWPTI